MVHLCVQNKCIGSEEGREAFAALKQDFKYSVSEFIDPSCKFSEPFLCKLASVVTKPLRKEDQNTEFASLGYQNSTNPLFVFYNIKETHGSPMQL